MSYSSVNYLNTLSTYVIAVVAVGGTFTGIIQALKWVTATEEGEVEKAKKNIKMVIIGVAVALSVKGLIYSIKSVIGG